MRSSSVALALTLVSIIGSGCVQSNDTKMTENLQDRLEKSDSEVRVIVKTSPEINSTDQIEGYGTVNHYFEDQNLVAVTASEKSIRKLSEKPWVEEIGPDKKVQTPQPRSTTPG